MYAPLWVKSNHSFLEGASHPEELVERAHALSLPAVALTDRDGVYGIVRAHVRARELGIRLLVGAEVTVARRTSSEPLDDDPRTPTHIPSNRHARALPRTRTRSSTRRDDPHELDRVVLLARSRKGYGDLCRLLSAGRARAPKGLSRVLVDELLAASGELVCLCPSPMLLPSLRDAFGHDLYALCTRHLVAEDVPREAQLRASAHMTHVPLVAATEVLYHDPARRPLQDVLACIRTGSTLSSAGTRIRPNSEHALMPASDMQALFRDDPASLTRTLEIAERCMFSLSELRYRYPAETVPDGTTPHGWLRTLTYRGAAKRYGPELPVAVTTQLDRELSLIEELDYGGYFLTMHEIVEYCRAHDILCQGRGSAANSAVCYCLGITAVDPVRMELLFERFLSRERAEPPDIDLDIEHERREEVIQHVYTRYGRRHAAMVANVICYRARSAVRDVGKVLGLEQTDLDALSRLVGYYDASLPEAALTGAGLDPSAPLVGHLRRLTAELVDFPRHLSIHPGGFLLGHEPVDTLVPIEPASMEGRTVIQWDKDAVESLGLFKVDLLGLGALTSVHRSLDLLRRHDGLDLDMATIPAEDAKTYAMTARGDTVGVFQIESRAQMAMLPRLKPRTFYDLVIEVAIVRPGPIQGDMVHPYLRRRAGEETVDCPHPSLERVLRRTLGVPIFQEQVMKLAMLAADYTPGEADQLRRDMAAWRSRGRIDTHHDRIVSRMTARGIPLEFAERVFAQIRGFGEYGFPESHAASFALIAYVTAWLRCHHLPAFTCGLLNSQPMGFYSPSTLVEDARLHGVVMRPIDVSRSSWDCTLEPAPPESLARGHRHAVRMGLRYVRGFGANERARLSIAPPPYEDLAHFVRATRLPLPRLTALAEAGAFRAFGLNRRDALWQVRGLAAHASDPLPLEPPAGDGAFEDLTAGQAIGWDYHASAHSTLGHPMERLRAALEGRGLPNAERVRAAPDGVSMTYVGMVICRQRPSAASGVTFFTLEDETGFVNVVVWRDVFDRHAVLAKTAALLGISGRVQSYEGVVHLVAERLWAPQLPAHEPDEPAAQPRSRDFH